MYCTKCGAEIKEEDGTFCSKCGQKLFVDDKEGLAGQCVSLEKEGSYEVSSSNESGPAGSYSGGDGNDSRKRKRRCKFDRKPVAVGVAALVVSLVAVIFLAWSVDGENARTANELSPAQQTAMRNVSRIATYNGRIIAVDGNGCLRQYRDYIANAQKQTSLITKKAAIKFGNAEANDEADKVELPTSIGGPTTELYKVAAFSGSEMTSAVLDNSGHVYWCNAASEKERTHVGGTWPPCVDVGAGNGYVLGVSDDGSVMAAGANEYGQCNVGGWRDVGQVCSDGTTSYGLKNDGTVNVAGANATSSVGGAVQQWKGIVFIAASSSYVVGVKGDGRVVYCRLSSSVAALNVDSLSGVVSVSVGDNYLIVLKDDGSVEIIGDDDSGQCDLPAGCSNDSFVTTEAGVGGALLVKDDGSVERTGGFLNQDAWKELPFESQCEEIVLCSLKLGKPR